MEDNGTKMVDVDSITHTQPTSGRNPAILDPIISQDKILIIITLFLYTLLIHLDQIHSYPAMATITNFLAKPPSDHLAALTNINPFYSHSYSFLFKTKQIRSAPFQARPVVPIKAAASAAGVQKSASGAGARVVRVHTIEEFDEALRTAKNRLVVVEYAASHSEKSRNIYPSMVNLSRTCNDVDFLLVVGDESEKTRELCKREKIERVPHFSFYKGMEKIHEEGGIGPDQLEGDVLYYGDSHSAVLQLHCREDVEKLIADHKIDDKLIVLDVGLKHCGPCVKVYPTVLRLSRQMSDSVVFARMNGDENDSCMEYLKDMNVVEVPTFLFIRNGKIRGRYVGSGKGELIGEILRYQGVKVT